MCLSEKQMSVNLQISAGSFVFVAHDVVMPLFPGLALLTEEFLRRLLSLFIKEQTWATETGPTGRKPGRQSS